MRTFVWSTTSRDVMLFIVSRLRNRRWISLPYHSIPKLQCLRIFNYRNFSKNVLLHLLLNKYCLIYQSIDWLICRVWFVTHQAGSGRLIDWLMQKRFIIFCYPEYIFSFSRFPLAFAVQTLPREESGSWPEGSAVFGDQRRPHHPLPRSGRQDFRHDPVRHHHVQDYRLHQVWGREPVHDHGRAQFGPRRYRHQPWKASRIFRRGPRPRLHRTCLCHKVTFYFRNFILLRGLDFDFVFVLSLNFENIFTESWRCLFLWSFTGWTTASLLEKATSPTWASLAETVSDCLSQRNEISAWPEKMPRRRETFVFFGFCFYWEKNWIKTGHCVIMLGCRGFSIGTSSQCKRYGNGSHYLIWKVRETIPWDAQIWERWRRLTAPFKAFEEE